MTYDADLPYSEGPGPASPRTTPAPIQSIHVDPPIGQIAAALAKAQGVYPTIPRDRTVRVQMKDKANGQPGGSYTFSYAPLDTILEKVRKPLSDNGLSITQLLTGNSLITMLMHESGEYLRAEMQIPRTGETGPQALGSAVTYLRRYTLQAILGVASDEDDDGNGAEGQSTTPAPQPKGGRVAATVQTRLRDTERPAAPVAAPEPAHVATPSPVAAPEAPVKPDEAQPAAPTAPEPSPDSAVVVEDPATTGLSVEEFKRLAREKHIFPAQLAAAAGELLPDEKGKTLAELTDNQRFTVLMYALANL